MQKCVQECKHIAFIASVHTSFVKVRALSYYLHSVFLKTYPSSPFFCTRVWGFKVDPSKRFPGGEWHIIKLLDAQPPGRRFEALNDWKDPTAIWWTVDEVPFDPLRCVCMHATISQA